MSEVRAAAAAGAFYAASPRALRQTVDHLLADASPPPLSVAPRMIVVPHAGHVFSGPVAATAFAALAALDEHRWRSVLLLGPAHFLRFRGLASPGCDAFATPLGRLDIDANLRTLAKAHAAENPAAHEREHSLEVQLPFLQRLWPHVNIMPILTGDDDPPPSVHLLRDVARHTETLIVVSSDLSHYLDQASAQRSDAATAAAIVALRPDDLPPRSACGRTAVRAGLVVAREQGWRCQQLDLRTSGEILGGLDRVVGYGAFVMGPTASI
ncbi:MAG TPA: AmmeMemoRadiSam system protein B [Acidimicrobiia bacterium]|jgi:AmmeMemoRadiSam system protein B|nr:AmmeMemoRadiSam system protein B [Acidimicrobiia bacterium]